MYKLAKFRKELKEKSDDKVKKGNKEALIRFKCCFYMKAYYSDGYGYINRSVRVRWDRYYALKAVIKNNKPPCFGWSHAKEGMKYGQ